MRNFKNIIDNYSTSQHSIKQHLKYNISLVNISVSCKYFSVFVLLQVHSQKHFFPWHRWYLLQFENLFRYIHKDVTLPYWDWSIAGERIWATDSASIWSKKSWGLGGNGKGLFHCVKDGPFSVYKWRLAYHSGKGCLKRNFKG